MATLRVDFFKDLLLKTIGGLKLELYRHVNDINLYINYVLYFFTSASLQWPLKVSNAF